MPKKICDNILEAIGHTPMVRINSLTKGVIAATVLAKVETFNPGNSIKDRMALKMIEDAEAMAFMAAPCLAVVDLAGASVLTDQQRLSARAILRSAVLRWDQQGAGALVQETIGPYSTTYDNRERRRGLLWPSEIEALQKAYDALSEGKPLYRAGLKDDQRAILAPYFLLTNRRVLVVVNVERMQALHDRRGSLPGEFHADLDRVLAHERGDQPRVHQVRCVVAVHVLVEIDQDLEQVAELRIQRVQLKQGQDLYLIHI